VAFQLVDDVLDFSADAAVLGKGLLADIGEGKMTLPVILARESSPEIGDLLARLTSDEAPTDAARELAARIDRGGFLERVRAIAGERTEEALAALRAVRDRNRRAVGAIEELSRVLLERRG